MASGGVARIGVVIHPRRDIGRALEAVRAWGEGHGVEVVQLTGRRDVPRVAPAGTAEEVGLVVALGGDGTVLTALRLASEADRPVLGVACGSLGALTTVAGTDVAAALDAFAEGRWSAGAIPVLHARDGDGREVTAFNDVVVVRDGGNQVATEIEVDGALYGRFAGDGVIAATELGSSAYALAAGGPLLAPGSDAWLVTPLAAHGGFVPAVVLGAASRCRLLAEPGYAGARVEVDGRPAQLDPRELALERRDHHGTIVRVGPEESFLTALRRRGLVSDSPRLRAREARSTT